MQHLLNVYFRRRWTELNSSFNLMRPGEPRGGGVGGLRAAMKATRGAGDGGVVAVHEKVRRLARQPRCPSFSPGPRLRYVTQLAVLMRDFPDTHWPWQRLAKEGKAKKWPEWMQT